MSNETTQRRKNKEKGIKKRTEKMKKEKKKWNKISYLKYISLYMSEALFILIVVLNALHRAFITILSH